MILGAQLYLAHGEPAGGAALNEILWASGVAFVLAAFAAAFGAAHRAGKTMTLTRLGAFSERVSGLPSWCALPAAIAAGALLTAAFGFYWDVATHIDNGRDPGPFANPSHYLIIFGLLGIALAGYVGVLLGADEDDRVAVRIRAGWRAPLGALLLMVCGTIAVLGFPLDDVWHRLFGQDVTLWGPTHIQMVGGAALSTLALWVLVAEGIRARAETPAALSPTKARVFEGLTAGTFLIGLSALQAEFDYSVPQFRLLFHPVMLALSASIALVVARIRVGRGGALAAALFFIAVRGILSLIVGPVLDHTTLHFPLYLIEALAVELVALRVDTARQVTFGALAGALIGTAGVAAAWWWSHVWMTMSCPPSSLPEASLAVVAGIAGGVLGGLIARSLTTGARQRVPAVLGPITGVVLIACLAIPLPIATVDGSATVAVDDPGARTSAATITLDPPDLARDPLWLNLTAWQGGGSVVAPLESLGEGRYRVDAVPISGEWKSLIRLHTGSAIVAVPVYLPEDPAIPAPEVPAQATSTRPFVPDKSILLREAKDTPPWYSWVGYGVLGMIVVIWIAVLTWGLRRMGDAAGPRSAGRPRPRSALHTSPSIPS